LQAVFEDRDQRSGRLCRFLCALVRRKIGLYLEGKDKTGGVLLKLALESKDEFMIVVARTSRQWMMLSTALSVIAIAVGLAFGIGFTMQYGGWWPILFGMWWVALGGITLSASVKNWRREGRGLGLDHHGVHYWRDTAIRHGEHVVIPWDDIIGVRAVSFKTEDWEEGLLLDLRESASNPAGGFLAEIALDQQDSRLTGTNVALLHNWYWEWNPWEVERHIEETLQRRNG